MLLLPTTITINAVAYNEAARIGVGLVLDSWEWDLDADLSAEFHEEGPAAGLIFAPTWHAGQSVSITANSATVHLGQIDSVHPVFGPSGWTFGYHSGGPKYLANQLPVTWTDGTGTITYNMPTTDEDWIPSLTGLTVGQILTNLLTLHAAALTAIGITTDATTTSQLAALTLVPPDTVYISGRLWNGIDGVLRSHARNVASFIDGAGKVRFIDTSGSLTDLTLTWGTDPYGPFRFGYSLRDCASRTKVRGQGNISPFYGRWTKLDLTKTWTTGQAAAWTEDSFVKPAGAYDTGTVNTVGGPTSVTLTSSDGALVTATNKWSTRQAWVHLYNSVGSALTFSEARPITANTSAAAGGSFTCTLGYDLENAGSTAYDSYAIIGTAGPVAGGGLVELVDVYRLFNVARSAVAGALEKAFPVNVPWFGYYGDSYVNTRFPEALIVNASGATFPATFKIVPQTGQIRFDQPVVNAVNTPADLALGGSHVVFPADIYVLLAYSRGALQAVYPPDISGVPQYAGTSFSSFGLQRTQTIDVDSWVYAGNQAQMLAYATMMHAASSDAIYTGSVPVLGAYLAAFYPGVRLSIASDAVTTGQETVKVPVRAFRLDYVTDGALGVLNKSALRCSSRRNPATGERYYVHPTQVSQLGFKFPDNLQSLTIPQGYRPGGYDLGQLPGGSADASGRTVPVPVPVPDDGGPA